MKRGTLRNGGGTTRLTVQRPVPRVHQANDLRQNETMNAPTTFWTRFRDEVRTVSSRTRRGAKRAFDVGVLRVDLVSLRRERGRALADLGERTLSIWNRGALSDLERDAEMLRLRTRVEGVEGAIASKEAELRQLRSAERRASEAPNPEPPSPER